MRDAGWSRSTLEVGRSMLNGGLALDPSTTAPVHVRQPFQADLPAWLQRKWMEYVSLERLTYIRCAVVLDPQPTLSP
jgi:hypothetical protein